MPDRERIAARLEACGEIAHGPGGGADRPAYSAAEAEAMLLVAGWAREAGLAPGVDRFGNLWALPDGSEGPVVTSGSHVDTVPDGGRYDGALGTVLALELADSMAGAGTARVRRRGGASLRRRHRRLAAARRHVARSASSATLRDADGVTAADARDDYLDALARAAARRACRSRASAPTPRSTSPSGARCASSGS